MCKWFFMNQHNVGPDLNPNLFDTLIVFLKNCLKKSDGKNHEKLAACKKLRELDSRKGKIKSLKC